MPQIIIKDRMDREGPVKMTLGNVYKVLPRNKPVSVSDSELEVLMNSHEANHIFVLPNPQNEVTHGTVDCTERPDAHPGGDEAGPGPNGKLR